MKFKEETKFNVRLETVAGGVRTEFKGIKLNTLLKWLKTAETAIEVNINKGNDLLLHHTNSKTININPNDKL
jgi:hypothetical protein